MDMRNTPGVCAGGGLKQTVRIRLVYPSNTLNKKMKIRGKQTF